MDIATLGIFRKMRDVFLRLQLWRRVERISREVRENIQSSEKDTPVVFFNASTRIRDLSQNAAFSLITSWGLELQGIPVVHFTCQSGMSRCVLGAVQGNLIDAPPCKGCIKNSASFFTGDNTHWFSYEVDEHLNADLQGLSLEEMKQYRFRDRKYGELVLPSMRWVLRRYHLMDDYQTRFLFREFILSAHNIWQKFSVFLEKHEPQTVVLYNGLFFPEAAARQAALDQGIRVITHEVGFSPLSGFFTEGLAPSYPINIPDEFELTSQQNKLLDGYLEERFQGRFTMAGIEFWPEIQSPGKTFSDLADRYAQVVVIFTNVVFDTSQVFANTVFSDMFDWLDCLEEFIRDYQDTLFIIRAHPDELRKGKKSKETVKQWVDNKKVDQLPNVVFWGPDEPVSSYELIDLAKFVLVYNSSIGLEASLMGVAVISAGEARYTHHDTVSYQDDIQDYLRTVKQFLEAEKIQQPVEHQKNARKFLFYQIFKVSLPFSRFLLEHPNPGFVRIKNFSWPELLPENSPTIKTLLEGILAGRDFQMNKD
mgnify:CR=1 FL=1